MKKKLHLIASFSIVFLFLNIQLISAYIGNRAGSEPYVSGNTFRQYCDFIIDENFIIAETKIPFDPSKVKKGDIIFVSTEPQITNLHKFFTLCHPKINEPYILITHNGDQNVPGPFLKFLDDPKIFAWFAQNVDISYHPKLIPIPIGLENVLWGRHYVEILNDLISQKINLGEKKYLLSGNFSIGTNTRIRQPVYDLFKQKKYCQLFPQGKIPYEYLIDVCHSKFILSPHGNGLDCIRTWEALYLGIFPVVKTSTLDPLYQDLPILIVNDWNDITEEFLESKYIEMKNKNYKTEKLYFKYWLDLIRNYQNKCKADFISV